ncbi:uncharacterized protein LOC124723154 [Schistocerca piceifrons]|uniref:uncharacterized protein LOC124723154 n=1 Tax=Schistocerca piceifrons TaxID=274613 RepID=UPI001F5F3A56|nr:uncharacterized protein LOC124723154 [Schistocerca piceifrons]XP_049807364.1 uncharacterized protein LOC126249726 [Schistocerca nitens]XP_049955784.1 uncharacterized protein LOC126471592 [Schistocerca serialis cubense]
MFSQRKALVLIVVVMLVMSVAQARYLPTRRSSASLEDRLDRLRDLINDLVESERPSARMAPPRRLDWILAGEPELDYAQ